MNTNMAVDVEGASLYRGTNVQMWEINGSNAQQWSIEKADKGYKLRARCNNYYMDINDAAYSSGTNVKAMGRMGRRLSALFPLFYMHPMRDRYLMAYTQ